VTKQDNITFGMTKSSPVQCTYNDGASCSGIHTGRIWIFECDTMTVHNDDTGCASYCDVYQNLKYLSSGNTTISATNLRKPISNLDDRDRLIIEQTAKRRAINEPKGSFE